MDDKLKEILRLCKCGVYLTVDNHKNNYETIEEYLEDVRHSFDIEESVVKEMITRDTIIELQCYTRTPVGFMMLYHYDLDIVLSEMLEFIRNE